MLKNLSICSLLLLAQPLMIEAQQISPKNAVKENAFEPGNHSVISVKKNITEDWLTAAQSYIATSEYFFNPVAGHNNYYVANKKQRTGFIIGNSGYSVSPVRFTDNPKNEDDWKVSLQLKYIGKGSKNIFEPSANQPGVITSQNRLTVAHENFSIEYLNDEAGLRQNFIINQRPSGKRNLSISMKATGDLHPVSENNAVQFKDFNGITRLYYRGLKVWDANHHQLKAKMRLRDHDELLITVDDSKATYPITVDPINQTPEWTTSADGILPTLIGQLAVEAAYGFSVAGLGDVNGDGFDDVAVGAPAMVDLISGTGTLASVGAVFVYYGSANGLPVIPDAKLQPTTCIAGALFGFSIAGGDVNKDNKADIIVGAPMDNVSISIGGTSTASGKIGKAYVFNGATLSTTTTPFLTLQLNGSGILENKINLSVNALFGFSVAVTEDLNGDGKKDMIVGAPTYAGIKAGLLGSHILDVQSGGAFVFLTNASNNSVSLSKLEPIKTSLLGLGLLESNINGLLFGYSVDGLGDYNGDGKPDVVATAPAGINASSISALVNGKLLQGSALVYYGTGAGVNVNSGATLTATSGGLLSNLTGSIANVANLFGVSVKGVKNALGARNGNVIVGAPLGNAIINVLNLQLKTGTVSLFKKKAASGYVIPDQILTSPRNSNNILQIIQSNLLFGYSLDNVLDVNCDGIGDIVVGEPASSGVQLLNANVAGGAAYVYLGKADGTYQAAPSWTLTAYEDAFLGVNATSLIGYSVAGAGKVKGAAGNNKILVGSPSRTLDFGSGLLNLGNTLGTLFSLVAGNNGVGKAFLFDTKQCITLNLTKKDVLCNGGNTGSITATFSDGTGPYMIKIDDGSYAAATSPTTFNGLSAGTHTITVKDANGTEKSVSINVTEPAAITATTIQVNPACPGESNGSFTINAAGGTGTLIYSKNAGASYQSTNQFTGLPAGTYNWIVKDANGCTKNGQVILKDPSPIVASATKTNPTYFGASNGSFTISASGGTGTLQYSKDGGTSYQSSGVFNGLPAGTYNWVVKDANGCTKTGQVILSCPADISVIVTKNNPLCCGTATGSFNLSASGGTAPYTYSKDGGASYQSSNSFTALSAGTYNWVVKDASGYTRSGQVILTNPPVLNATATGTNPTSMSMTNGSIKITASGGTGTLNYSKNGGSTYQSSNIFSNLGTGTYNWVVKDANGCTKSGQVTLTCSSGARTMSTASQQISLAATVLETKLDIFPNPATTSVTLYFETAKTGRAGIALYSIDGKFIASIYNSIAEPGITYQKHITLDKLSAGIYIIQFQNAESTISKKLLILK